MKRLFFVIHTLLLYIIYFSFDKKEKAQEILFSRFYQLGGIYIKFLQILAMQEQNQAIEVSSLKNALSVFDKNEFEPIDIWPTLVSELGEKAQDIKMDNFMPFAAGSFAQVYEAKLNDKTVIIKVLRPSVLRNLNNDLNILGVASKIIAFFQRNQMVDFVQVINDLRQMTRNETNYSKEVENAINLREKLDKNETIYIPTTYKDYSTNRIIVQEKLSGLSVASLLDSKISNKTEFVQNNLNTDLNFVMEVLAVELVEGSLSSQGTYGDPHPGNIYIMTNNRIGLIDFGIGLPAHINKSGFVHLLTQYSALYNGKFNPADFSKAMVQYFAPDLTESLQNLSVYFGKQDLVNKVLDEIGEAVDKTIQDQSDNAFVGSLIGQYRMMYLLTNIVNKKNRLSLSLSIEQPEFLRSTHIFLSMIHLLGCDKKTIGIGIH